MPPASVSKKSKSKKAPDQNETTKLLQAKISQLEQDAAGEKDQEVEIGGYFGPFIAFWRYARRVFRPDCALTIEFGWEHMLIYSS